MTRVRFALTVFWALSSHYYCLAQSAPAANKITFEPPGDQSLGSFALNASATSGAVTFKTSPDNICTLSGTTVNLVGKGACTITASAPGADDVVQTVNVNAGGTATVAGVDAVFGIGSLITGNRTDYKVNTSANVLEGTHIGRASPQLPGKRTAKHRVAELA